MSQFMATWTQLDVNADNLITISVTEQRDTTTRVTSCVSLVIENPLVVCS